MLRPAPGWTTKPIARPNSSAKVEAISAHPFMPDALLPVFGSGVSKEPLDQPATDRYLAPSFVFKPRELRNAVRICLGETAVCCEAAGCFVLLAQNRGALISGIRTIPSSYYQALFSSRISDISSLPKVSM